MSAKIEEALSVTCEEPSQSSDSLVSIAKSKVSNRLIHSDYRDYLGQRLRELRAENSHYNIARVAQKIGVDPSLISRLLRKSRHLDLCHVENVIEAFKIPANERELFFFLFLRSRFPAGASPVLDGLLEQSKLKVTG